MRENESALLTATVEPALNHSSPECFTSVCPRGSDSASEPESYVQQSCAEVEMCDL